MPPDYTDLASDDEIEEMVCSECLCPVPECICDGYEPECWECDDWGCPECEGEEGRT